jgi:anti-sigma factor RsiW
MNCSKAKRLLSSWLDCSLASADERELSAHLSVCSDCYRELRSLEETDSLLRSLGDCATPSGFAGRLALRLEDERRRAFPPWLARAANVSLAIFGGIGLALLFTAASDLVSDPASLDTLTALFTASDWPSAFMVESLIDDPLDTLGELHEGAALASETVGGAFLLGATIVLISSCIALLEVLAGAHTRQPGWQDRPIHR